MWESQKANDFTMGIPEKGFQNGFCGRKTTPRMVFVQRKEFFVRCHLFLAVDREGYVKKLIKRKG
jgi:hypothetical protein